MVGVAGDASCAAFQLVEPCDLSEWRHDGWGCCLSADSTWGTAGIVSAARSQKLLSSTFDCVLREELPLPSLCHSCDSGSSGGPATNNREDAGSALFGGMWFWEVYSHALLGESLCIDLGGTGVSLAEDTVATQKQLRLQCAQRLQMSIEQGSNLCNDRLMCASAHTTKLLHGSSKMELLYALSLSICMHLVNLPILEDHHGPQALILCATKDECDEMTFVLNKFATQLHMVVHNLFGLYPTIPREKRAEIVVATPTLWESIVRWSRTPAHDSFEGILTLVHGNTSLPTYTSTRWRPYSLKDLAQIVLFDVEMQLNLGFGVMLRRLFATREEQHRTHTYGASHGAEEVKRQNVAASTWKDMPLTPSAAATNSACQLYIVVGGDRAVSSAVADELSELASLAYKSCRTTQTRIALKLTDTDELHRSIVTSHGRKRTRDENAEARQLDCGLLIHNALSNSRLHVDPTAYEELCRGVWKEMQSFWQNFESACQTTLPCTKTTTTTSLASCSTLDIYTHTDCAKQNHSSGCVGEGEDVHRKNTRRDVKHADRTDMNVDNAADEHCCFRHGQNTETADTKSALTGKFQFRLAFSCAPNEGQQKWRVREACLLVSPCEHILCTHRTRIDLLFKHLEDTLNGQLFDGSVIVCENMDEVNVHHGSTVDSANCCDSPSVNIKSVGSVYHIIASNLVAVPELFMHNNLSDCLSAMNKTTDTVANVYLPHLTPLFIAVSSASNSHTAHNARADDFAWNMERKRTVAVAAAVDTGDKRRPADRPRTGSQSRYREGMLPVEPQQQDVQPPSRTNMPHYAFLDDRLVSFSFTVVVLRNIARMLTELTGSDICTDSAAESCKPFALLLLEECCQYGRVLSYFCYATAASTTSLFVEFDSTDAAMEATRMFSIRLCVPTGSATTAIHASQLEGSERTLSVRLFRNDTYYAGVRQQLQKSTSIESGFADSDNNDDDDDGILSDVSLLDE